jgi:DnaJ-class molecular chaperone
VTDQICEACNGSGEYLKSRLARSFHPDNIGTCKVCKGEGSVPAYCCPKCGYDLESEHPGFLHTCPECSGVA